MGNWQRSRWSAAQMEGIARNYPDATNTGLLCGELVGLDVDTPDAETADAIRAMVMELPGSDRAPYRMGKAPKTLFAFRATEPREKRATGAYLINGAKCQVEAFGERTQFVAFGTHPDTGRPYEWFNGRNTVGRASGNHTRGDRRIVGSGGGVLRRARDAD
ncbi:bifunctional DNA primase/polymerase [Bradyrhizobium japonicum]|uniref:bifunctional DNA primase/polymerase n=1 Tax=Bradyrhizobium japonicum TaxID=375 RepID=UPI001FCB1CCF|nr:bifunctional DNA primase/polymerase [Bradyrhizobium japonicum]